MQDTTSSQTHSCAIVSEEAPKAAGLTVLLGSPKEPKAQ